MFGALSDRIMETVRCAETEPAIRILDRRAVTPLFVGLSKTIAWYRERRFVRDESVARVRIEVGSCLVVPSEGDYADE
jgi:hypothetical protein